MFGFGFLIKLCRIFLKHGTNHKLCKTSISLAGATIGRPFLFHQTLTDVQCTPLLNQGQFHQIFNAVLFYFATLDHSLSRLCRHLLTPALNVHRTFIHYRADTSLPRRRSPHSTIFSAYFLSAIPLRVTKKYAALNAVNPHRAPNVRQGFNITSN